MGRSMHRAEEACKKATYAPHMGEAPLRGYAVIYIYIYISLQDATQAACKWPKRSMQEENIRPPYGGSPFKGIRYSYFRNKEAVPL